MGVLEAKRAFVANSRTKAWLRMPDLLLYYKKVASQPCACVRATDKAHRVLHPGVYRSG
eukprot:jgi/Botrbrau1/5810/Bobra.0155s0032.1